jgi:hypothetical protein
MSSKGGAPAAPDYTPIANSSMDAANIAAGVSRDQLAWAKQQYADQEPYTKSIMQNMADTQKQDMSIAGTNQANAAEAQAYYKQHYQPIEAQFAQTAQGYASPERAAQRSAAAQADVANAYEGQRHAALQSLESFGIDPSQLRYGALDLGTRISQAANQAAAGTTSRNQSEATGLALQGEAINIGRGYPGQVANAYGTAVNAGQGGVGAGSSGVQAGLNTSNTYGNLMGTSTQWAGMQNAGLNTSMGATHQGFQDQMAGFNANAAIAQNTMSGIGGLAGAGIMTAGVIAV